jgi:hypothetical protein
MPGQQLSVVVLGACGTVALGLAAEKLRHNVYAPFMVDKATILESKKIVGLTEEQMEEIDKRRDTDGDGISDWDEIHRTKTNPNLYDSCGDGLPDNIRILTGKNVNCRESGVNVEGRLDVKGLGAAPKAGQVGAIPSTDHGAMFGQQFFQDLSKIGPSLGASGTQLMGDGRTMAPALARDPQMIRSFLSDKIEPGILDRVSDEELLKLFDEVAAEKVGIGATTTDH